MMISPGRRYIFVHAPKTGGTAMALALEARAMKDDIMAGDTPKAKARTGRLKTLGTATRLSKHSRLSDLDGYLGAEAPPAPEPTGVESPDRGPESRRARPPGRAAASCG